MHKTPEITCLIHDNFWIVLSFAFARPVIGRIINEKFKGEWKYLHKAIYENAEIRADRALLELGTQLRALDGEQALNDIFKQTHQPAFGEVIQGDGARTEMHFRDMTNKIIHGSHYEWRLGDDNPMIVIHSNEPQRWQTAELSIIRLMGLIGQLMF